MSLHKQNQSTYLMKRAMKRQPSSDTVEAERTTTTTLPAMLTRAPRPAPTMIWASWTMQVRAAQSTPVPRPISLLPRSWSRSWGGRWRLDGRRKARESLMTHLSDSSLTSSHFDKVSTELASGIKRFRFAIDFRTTAGNRSHRLKSNVCFAFWRNQVTNTCLVLPEASECQWGSLFCLHSQHQTDRPPS